MRPFSVSQIDLPLHWTADQAFTVIDFLEDINTAIWDLYGDAIFAAKRQRNLAPLKRAASDDDDDDLPF